MALRYSVCSERSCAIIAETTIDAVNAREHITTVGPQQPNKKVDGPLRIAVSPKSFYYRNAVTVAPSTENN